MSYDYVHCGLRLKRSASVFRIGIRSSGCQAPCYGAPLRLLLSMAKQQPPDLDRFVTTSYGVAAARLDEHPAQQPAGDDGTLFQPLNRSVVLEPRAYAEAGADGGGLARDGGFFSTSMLSKQPNDCCMDEAYQRSGSLSLRFTDCRSQSSGTTCFEQLSLIAGVA